VIRALALAAAATQITVIVTESLLFKPFREAVQARSAYLGELVGCHLCFGTWVGLVLSLVARPRFVTLRGPLGGVLGWAIDGFAIAYAGRLLNEHTGKIQREVKVLDETVERLERDEELPLPERR
jgi:hypothetical protein